MPRHASNEPDTRFLAAAKYFYFTVQLLIAGIAATVLLIWFLPALAAHVSEFWVEMGANTAVALLLCTLSLFLSFTPRLLPERFLGQAVATVVLVVSLLSLGGAVANVSIGVDRWLPYNPNIPFPGRPSPQSAAEFTILALSLLTVTFTRRPWSYVADFFAVGFITFTFVMLGGHLYGAIDLARSNPASVMAPHSLLCFFGFSAMLILRRAELGELFAVIVNIGIGSRIVRLILPIALFTPFVFLAADAYLVKSGMLREPYAQSLSAASGSTLLLFIVAWMGWRINALERDLRDLSLTDELTGVYNRRGFYFLGQQAMRETDRGASRLTLFFFDLDGLKQVNDAFGHEVGSELIQGFAKILNRAFRKGDIVGRLGGDEFAVITVHDPAARPSEIFSRLEAMTRSYNSGGKSFRLGFSVGYAELDPEGFDTLDDIITRADAMMYKDKASKKGAE